jgi:cytochrome c oxidase subunit 2
MHHLEKKLILLAVSLMVIFTALVIYASMSLDIVLPTCDDHVTPFTTADVIPKPNNQFDVHFVARMWSFEPAELILPEQADVNVYVSAIDVQHGFEVTGTNLNLMVIPGTVNSAHHRFDRKGDYLVVCHEYCGLNHQNMFSKIRVVSHDEYDRLMQQLAQRVTGEGEKLSTKYDCASCHSVDGTEGLGPTFKGLYGKKEKLNDGKEIVVDQSYLIESIQNPDKHIVKNYEAGSMPQATLSDEEIKTLVDYIKALK